MHNNFITYQGPCTRSSKHEKCGLASSHPGVSIDAFLRSLRLPPSRGFRYCILHEYMILRLSSCEDGEEPEFVSWYLVAIVCLTVLRHRFIRSWAFTTHQLIESRNTMPNLSSCKPLKTIQTVPNIIKKLETLLFVFAVSHSTLELNFLFLPDRATPWTSGINITTWCVW